MSVPNIPGLGGLVQAQQQQQQAVDFGPSDLGKLSEEEAEKLHLYYHKLCQYRDTLPANLHARMPNSELRQLAECLVDGTMFEIVRELEDIQQLSERALLNKRMKVVSAQKAKKVEMVKRHEVELLTCHHRPHNLPLIKAKHEKEKAELDKQLQEEVRATDQQIILELDQLVTNQQTTMQQADVTFFSVTNNPQEVQVQMHVLRFIQKLGQLNTAPQ